LLGCIIIKPAPFGRLAGKQKLIGKIGSAEKNQLECGDWLGQKKLSCDRRLARKKNVAEKISLAETRNLAAKKKLSSKSSSTEKRRLAQKKFSWKEEISGKRVLSWKQKIS
jgi:hypothetical protein